jgi:hypothetical protein
MQADLKVPSWANGEALPDKSDPGVNTNWSPATVPTSTVTFCVSTQASIVFPESLVVERSARPTEEA